MKPFSMHQTTRRALKPVAPLAVLLAAAQPSQAAYDQIAPLSFTRMCPAHVGGDREYNGNGPDVDIRLHLVPIDGGLEIHAEMYQIETQPDFTQAFLSRFLDIADRADGYPYTHIWMPDASGTYRWQQIIGEVDTFTQQYEDQSHSAVTVRPTNFWLDEVISNGDTKGNDIAQNPNTCGTDDAYLTVRTRTMYLGFLCSTNGC